MGNYLESGFDNFLIRAGYSGLEPEVYDNINIGEILTAGSIGNVQISSIAGEKISSGDMDIRGWTTDIVFTQTDHNTLSWGSGDIVLSNSTTYTIDAGNTGNVSAITYIYLDIKTSETVFQKTTTASDAVGANKILVAVCNDVASGGKIDFQSFGGDGLGKMITADDIVANTITANEIAANTITASQIYAGTITATEMTISTLSAISANMGTITAGTVTGATLQTASSGRRVIMANDQYIRWKDGGSTEGYIYNDGSGNMTIDADNILNLTADGSGDDVNLRAGDLVYTQSDVLWSQCNGFRTVYCDNDFVNFNDDNTGGACYWTDQGDPLMKLLSSNESLYIDGQFIDTGADFAEMFESTKDFSKEKIPAGTSVILIGDKIRPAFATGETPFGVISAKPTIVGNIGGSGCDNNWGEKYLKDGYGNQIKEKAEYWSIYKDVEITKPTGQKVKRKKRIKGYSDEIPAPKGAKKKMVMRKKINSDWEKNKKYVPRLERTEWNVVGLLGRLRITKGQPVSPSWIKLRNISDTIEEWLIK